MKLVTGQPELSYALRLAGRAVASGRNSHPILSCIRLAAAETACTATAFDLNLAISHSWEAAIEQPGTICVPYRLFSDLIARLPTEEPITLSCADNFMVKLSTATGTYDIAGLNPDDYPDLPAVSADAVAISLSVLSEGIKAVAGFSSNDEAKQILQAIRLRIDATSGAFDLAATDGHRLAAFGTLVDSPAVAIPAKAAREILRSDRSIPSADIASARDHISIQLGDTTILSRLLEGTYPNVEQLIPKKFDHKLELNRHKLIDALERVAVIASNHNDVVMLRYQDSLLSINAETDAASGGELVTCESATDGNFKFGVNVHYLIDGLKAIAGPNVILSANTPTLPFILQPAEDPSSQLVLIMPVQVRQ